MALKKCPGCSGMIGTACKRCALCGHEFFSSGKVKKDDKDVVVPRVMKQAADDDVAVILCKKILMSACVESIGKFADMLEEMGDNDCSVIRQLYGLNKVEFNQEVDYALFYYKNNKRVVKFFPNDEVQDDQLRNNIISKCEQYLNDKYKDEWRANRLCVLKYTNKNEIIEKKYLEL